LYELGVSRQLDVGGLDERSYEASSKAVSFTLLYYQLMTPLPPGVITLCDSGHVPWIQDLAAFQELLGLL
jgi:hypothetical protein